MKKLISIIIAALLVCCSADAQHIKDENLQAYIRSNYPKAIDKNGDLTKKAGEVISITIRHDDDVKTLEGIEGLTGLNKLKFFLCVGIKVNKLPASLKELDCSNAKLSVLPDLPPNLVELDCASDALSALPKLPATLQKLDCGN